MPQERYSIIYRFFKMQIEFGYYRCGDCLPTMEQLHRIYHAAVRTVRSAYAQLQEEGYVSLSSGRKTLVVWDASPAQTAARAQDYYLAREQGFRDVEAAVAPLLCPLLEAGCARLEAGDMDEVGEMTAALADKSFYVAFFCARKMLEKLQNKLVLDLYDELAAYYQFPHSLHQRVEMPDAAPRLAALSRQLAADCTLRDRQGLYHTYRRLQDLLQEILQAYLRAARAQRPLPAPMPFRWQVYRARPQVCYSLAAHLCGRIYIGKLLPPGRLLPSYNALAAEYGVSLSTVRRAMELLEMLGVVTALQGTGTRVACVGPRPGWEQDKASPKLLGALCEALQVTRVAFNGVAEQLFPRQRRNAADAAAVLREKQAQHGGFLPFFCAMGFLLYENRNPALRQIWEKFYETLLLGLPLVQSRAAAFPAAKLDALAEALAESLETGSFSLFHDSLWELAGLAEQAAAELAQTAAKT